MAAIRDYSAYFQAIEETAPVEKKKKNFKVENVFKPEMVDGKASVVLRFLPAVPSESKPFVKNMTHMYEFAPKQFFGCDCLEKFGKKCPICEHNMKLYKKYTKDEAAKLRLPNARQKFISNVYVVKNDANPDLEGKVYRFEYGVQIMEIIRKAMKGDVDPEDGVIEGYNPFDYKQGANFIYEAVQGAKGPKLDKCRFGKRRPISDKNNKELTAAQIDDIESKLYTLDEYDRKEEDVDDYDKIVERFEEKVGRPLFGDLEDAPVVTNDDDDEAPKKSKTAKAKVTESAVDVFTDEPADEDDDVSSTEVTVENSTFFNTLV